MEYNSRGNGKEEELLWLVQEFIKRKAYCSHRDLGKIAYK